MIKEQHFLELIMKLFPNLLNVSYRMKKFQVSLSLCIQSWIPFCKDYDLTIQTVLKNALTISIMNRNLKRSAVLY